MTPRPVTAPDPQRNELAHVAPHFLPDGRHFFYLALTRTASGRSVAGGTYVSDIDATGPPKLVLAEGSNVAYAGRHLLFARDSTLMGQPFDDRRLELTGDPVPVAERVTRGGYFAFGQGLAFSASDEGTLAYQSGQPSVQLTWFDRGGKKLGVVGDALPPDAFGDVALSRDGRWVVANSFDVAKQATALWSYDLQRGSRARLTFENVDDLSPVLSPDGTRVVFGSRRRGSLDLFERSAVGGGSDAELLVSASDKYPMSWSADGRYLLYVVNPPGELWALRLQGDRTSIPLIRGPFSVLSAQLSPDGRWIAYASTEAGRSGIYVTEFPKPLTKTPLATGEGDHPRWSRDGKELFFRSKGALMTVPVLEDGGRIGFGPPRTLFDVRRAMGAGGPSRYFYDVASDGQRFLVGMRTDEGLPDPERGQAAGSISLLLNWPGSLTRK